MVSLSPTATRRLTGRRRVEILGAFGAGKSTIAASLARRSYVVLAEQHEQNIYWGKADATEITGYLAYDLGFLLQHAYLAASHAVTRPQNVGICDWSFVSDRLWASMRLDEDLSLYDAIHARIQERLGAPLGYLYLRQPTSVVVHRLLSRGREPEAALVQHVEAAVLRLETLVSSLPSAMVMPIDDNTSTGSIDAQIGKWIEESTCA